MEQRTNVPPRRLLPAVAVLLSALALAAPAVAQNLGGPDAPPSATPAPTPAPTEVTPTVAAPGAADAPPAATPSPSAPVAPVATPDPAAEPSPSPSPAPAGDAAAQADARSQAAAAAEHARALRAAAQRKRIRANITAVRDAALEGGQALSGTPEANRAAAAAAGSAAVTPVVTDPGDSGTGRQRILLILLGAAALGFALAAYPSLSRRGGALERVRLELAGVSVACVLVLLLVLAGIV